MLLPAPGRKIGGLITIRQIDVGLFGGRQAYEKFQVGGEITVSESKFVDNCWGYKFGNGRKN